MSKLLGPLRLLDGVVCLVISIILAVAAYGIGKSLQATYQASGTIRVAVPPQGGLTDPAVIAFNDLATQYTQLVGTDAVASLTAAVLKVPAASLHGKLSASTLGAQNLLQVTATAPNPSEAEARAKAATYVVTGYIDQLNADDTSTYVNRIEGSIAKLLTIPRGATPSLRIVVQGQTYGTLGQIIRDTAGRPTLLVIDPVGSASETAPKPKLYALIALIVALLVTFRAAFVIRRGSRSES